MGHLELRWAPEPDSAQDEEQEGLFLWFDVFLSFHFLFSHDLRSMHGFWSNDFHKVLAFGFLEC